MMTRWRSLFVTGAMLSALVLFGTTTALAQPPTKGPKPTVAMAGADGLTVSWDILTWQQRAAGGGALVDTDQTDLTYRVAYSKGKTLGVDANTNTTVNGIANTPVLSTSLSGLEAGTEYTVAVSVEYPAGRERDGDATTAGTAYIAGDTDYSDATTGMTDYAAPMKPMKPTLTVTGYDGIRVRWTPNSDASSLTSYTLYYKAGTSVSLSDPMKMSLSGDDIQAELTDLMPGTEYAVGLTATNPKGTSALSDVETETTDAAPTPDRVSQPTVTEEGDGSLTLDWPAPAAGGTGITIVRYMVQFQEMGDASWLDWNPSPTMSEVTLTGLTNEKTYRVQVKAVNSVEGVSADWSIPASGTPMVEEPPPPPPALGKPMPTLGMPTHDSVMVSWDAVEGADSYNVNWHVADSGVSQNAHVPMGTEYTITDLMPETMYYVSVCANRGPDFECSDDMSFTTGAMPGPELTAPMNVMVAPGDGMLTVSWDAVESADSYKVSWTGGGVSSSATTMEMPYPIMGLMNGTTYMVTVMAMAGDMEGPASAAVSETPMPSEPVPALPLFGMLALGAGLVAAGRRRLHAQRLLK